MDSFLFSIQSIDKKREFRIILLQNESINTLFSTFQKDWDKGTDF